MTRLNETIGHAPAWPVLFLGSETDHALLSSYFSKLLLEHQGPVMHVAGRLLALSLAALFLTSCIRYTGNPIPAAVVTALEKGESFELLSLDPQKVPGDGETRTDDTDKFQGWKVRGRTMVKAADRSRLVQALQKGVAENEGMAAACFIPRHGIRVVHGGKTYDVVICFQCLSANTYVDGKRTESFLLTGSPQRTFDAVLTAAGVKLPKAKE